MKKQIIILTNKNNEPIKVLDIKSLELEDFVKVKKECETNYKKDIQEKDNFENGLLEKIANLEKRLHNVELELAYNRGDIDEETYKKEVQ